MPRNREENKLYMQEWRKKNPARYHEIQLKHYHNNKEFYHERNTRRLDTYIYDHTREEIYEKYGAKCLVCGVKESPVSWGRKNLHIHHIDGTGKKNLLARTGYVTEEGKKVKATINNDISNLVPLCSSCHPKVHTYKSIKLPKII